MSILWQITIVESLLNLSIFSVAVIAFGFLTQMSAKPVSRRVYNAGVGVLFGLASAAVLMLPIHLSGGASTGSQSILLALAGLIAGPVAGVTALILALLANFVESAGSVVANIAMPSALSAVATGILFRLTLGPDDAETRLRYYHFPLLGLVCAVCTLGILWKVQGLEAAETSAVPALLAAILSCTVLGTLLLHEQRRNQAEVDLRDSEARLYSQAAELAEARDLAEQANHSKSAFLANMSHELRTPLNAILGFSDMIAQEYMGPVGTAQYKDYAADINASGQHLLNLINDLLDVAKIEAGRMEIAPAILDPAKIFEHVRMLMAIRVREKRLKFSLLMRPGTPPLYADDRALKQMLINLVSNAVKFTPEGGSVTIMVGPHASGGVEIACIDTGTGIPREKLDKIFTPFSQVDNRFNRQAGGTGLGLALVRGLAELHGGRAWLESEYGKGCKAYIVLPPKPIKRENSAA